MKTVFQITIIAILLNIPFNSKANVVDQLTDALNTGSSITYGGSYGGGHTHNWWCWWYGCSYDDDGGGNDVPLDGGLSFLAIAGAGLGIKKYKDSRKKNKQPDK